MPWHIERKDGKHCVVKDADNSVEKCHVTAAQAKKHMAALYASEAKETAEKAIDGAGVAEDTHEKMMEEKRYYVPYGVTSFSELQAAREASHAAVEMSNMASDLQDLLANRMNAIMMDETVENKAAAIVTSLEELAGELANLVESEAQTGEEDHKEFDPEEDEAGLFQRFKDWLKAAPMKTVDGKKYPASDFLVTEDPQSPSTWHLQVKRNGKPNRGLAGAACAALFSPGGHRGNKYAGPGKEAAGKKLRALYKAEGWELPGGEKELGFMVWKEADGSYRWMARYSNNFRDQDSPPEIISAQSHKRFDELLSKGQAPMPELWLWHRPEWRWGIATWHAYDDSGFALAAGAVNKGAEPLAEQLMALDPSLVRVSHGMPTSSIAHDANDESVIVEHITREISPLPAWAAANQHTGFIILKETDMAIPQDKRDALTNEWNLSDELLTQLEAANAADAKEADEAGIEKKEVVVEAVPEVIAEAAPETPPEPAPEPGITREEMRAALEQIGTAIRTLSEQVKELQGTVVEVKEQKTVEEAATLSEIFQRAIGHSDARLDGRTTAAKDRPVETQPDKPGIVNTGNPLADQVVNSIVSGGFLESLRGPQQPQ